MKIKISVVIVGIMIAISLTACVKEGRNNTAKVTVDVTPSVTKAADSAITQTPIITQTPAITQMPIPSNTPGVMSKEEAEEILAKLGFKQDDSVTIESYAKTYGKSKEEIKKLKDQLKNWTDVAARLIEERNRSKQLPKDKVLELYEQGYSVEDIEKAELFAAQCDKSPEEVLKIKGRTLDFVMRDVDENAKKNTKTWDEVAAVLGIDNREWYEKLGISKNDVERMKKKGYSEKQIADIVALASKYNKNYKETFEQVEKGKSIEKLEEVYKKERENNKNIVEGPDSEEREAGYIKQLGITQEVVDKCKKNGLRDLDMAEVSYLSNQYKVSADLIIEKYKKTGNWQAVIDELNAGTND